MSVRALLACLGLSVSAALTREARAATPTDPTTETGQDAGDEVTVRGHAHVPSRGASDHEISIGKLALVPRSDAAGLLRLAPGVLLTNEGGTGHPYQIYLRGFDAREGQDIELSVGGMPINEVGNPHGNGLADTHFILPELVMNLRVIEGPFAPQQGNFAVAGSALYDVGLADPGLTTRVTYGSFDTKRLLVMWRPEEAASHTFGGAEVFESDGFGANRSSKRATAMGGYEGRAGKSGSFRLLLSSYGTHYASAGALREDDVLQGRRDFFDTYDTQQGGDSSRHSISAVLEDKLGASTRISQSAFFVLRDFRIRENLTGFQNDPQETWQSEHSQRGDLIDQAAHTLTLGARGSARQVAKSLGERQEIELGYFARYDDVTSTQQRDRFGTIIPYRKDLDLQSGIGNLGLYADASVKPALPWLTLRGGLRADVFSYRVRDGCAQRTQATAGAPPSADIECFSSDRAGYRSADQTSSTAAGAFQPRASVLVGPFAGFTGSASYGIGSRSLDPQYVNQNLDTPFARVTAAEGGIAYLQSVGSHENIDVLVKSVFFQTHVERDLFFNPTEGRNTLSGGTTRTGWAGNTRVTGSFFDVAGSVTLVRATFDDNHLLIPYAPSVVTRLDGAVFSELPIAFDGKHLVGSLGFGLSYVGKRPLPENERSNEIATIDAAADVRYGAVRFGLSCTNLTDRVYRLSEYNYASDFHSQPYPTRVAARHFIAGEPRAVYATLTFTFGKAEGS